MKLTTTQKKKAEKIAERAVFLVTPRVYVLCPICGGEFGNYDSDRLNIRNIFVQTTVTCLKCKRDVVVLEPMPKKWTRPADEPLAKEPEISETTAPEKAEDAAQPPILGVDPATAAADSQRFTELVEKAAADPKLQALLNHPGNAAILRNELGAGPNGTSSRFDAPTFGASAHDIDEAVEARLAGAVIPINNRPPARLWPSALLGALIAVLFMGALVGLALYFKIPLPVQKPSPEVQPTQQQSNTMLPGDDPGFLVGNAKPAALPFSWELSMNDEAWVAVDVDGKELVPGSVIPRGRAFGGVAIDKVSIRCGKPGAMSYWIDGKQVSPMNNAELPDKVEVVTLTAGMYPKEQ